MPAARSDWTVHSGTVPAAAHRYSGIMQRKHMKSAVIGAWVLACGVMALLLDVGSASGWALLIGSAVVPPLVLLQVWRPPAQTMSESIREVLK